jgi:hypothetical protein
MARQRAACLEAVAARPAGQRRDRTGSRSVGSTGLPSAGDIAEREYLLSTWQAQASAISAPQNRLFEAVLASNLRDAASFPLLEGPRDEWLAMQAGVPLYPAFFGRDALTAGWQMAMIDCGACLDAALTRLARHQSTRVDDSIRRREIGLHV